jgi:hypothetical protein
MRTAPCVRSDDVAAACRTAQWDEALRSHAAACPDCRQTMMVADGLRALAEEPAALARPLPDPAIVLRKARLLARFREEDDLSRRAMRPVHVVQWAALLAALLGIAWASLRAVDLPAAAALGATPEWVQDAARVLGRPLAFSLAAALALAAALRLLWAEE